MCGHARKSQLDRNLVIPSEKNNLWVAAGAAALSFLTLGSHKIQAQTPAPTEQVLTKPENPAALPTAVIDSLVTTTGVVSDEIGPVQGCIIMVNGKPQIQVTSDIDGNYSITANKGNRLVFIFAGYENQVFEAKNQTLNVTLKIGEISEGIIITSYKRTFFGRIFHSIGKLFR